MTEKRLIVRDGDYAWIDTTTGYVVEIEDAFDLINQLHEENEQLKEAYNDAKADVEKKEQILKDIMNDNLLIQDMKRSWR